MATASIKTPPVQPGGYKLREAAQYCGGLNIETLRRLIRRGLIKPCRGLRHVLISKAELDRFLSEN